MTVPTPYGPFPMFLQYHPLHESPHFFGNDKCEGPSFGPFVVSQNKFKADGSCEQGKFACGRLFSAQITKL